MNRPVALIQLLAALAALAASAPGLTTAARGDTVSVRKTAKPVIARTKSIYWHDQSINSCFPEICPIPAELGYPDFGGTIRKRRILVGFSHAYYEGTKPCNCWSGGALASRGMVLFKTEDIPHHFKSATLVLFAEDDTNVDDPVALATHIPFLGIFETPPGRNVFSRADVQFYPSDGIVTSGEDRSNDLFEPFGPIGVDPELQLNNAVAFPFPFPPYPNGAVLERTDRFSFRIDVTNPVRKWVADWPHRNDTPLHGFILVGTDESLPHDQNRSAQITYIVWLEFEIDEPDR
jgi:hypothetical protein